MKRQGRLSFFGAFLCLVLLPECSASTTADNAMSLGVSDVAITSWPPSNAVRTTLVPTIFTSERHSTSEVTTVLSTADETSSRAATSSTIARPPTATPSPPTSTTTLTDTTASTIAATTSTLATDTTTVSTTTPVATAAFTVATTPTLVPTTSTNVVTSDEAVTTPTLVPTTSTMVVTSDEVVTTPTLVPTTSTTVVTSDEVETTPTLVPTTSTEVVTSDEVVTSPTLVPTTSTEVVTSGGFGTTHALVPTKSTERVTTGEVMTSSILIPTTSTEVVTSDEVVTSSYSLGSSRLSLSVSSSNVMPTDTNTVNVGASSTYANAGATSEVTISNTVSTHAHSTSVGATMITTSSSSSSGGSSSRSESPESERTAVSTIGGTGESTSPNTPGSTTTSKTTTSSTTKSTTRSTPTPSTASDLTSATNTKRPGGGGPGDTDNLGPGTLGKDAVTGIAVVVTLGVLLGLAGLIACHFQKHQMKKAMRQCMEKPNAPPGPEAKPVQDSVPPFPSMPRRISTAAGVLPSSFLTVNSTYYKTPTNRSIEKKSLSSSEVSLELGEDATFTTNSMSKSPEGTNWKYHSYTNPTYTNQNTLPLRETQERPATPGDPIARAVRPPTPPPDPAVRAAPATIPPTSLKPAGPPPTPPKPQIKKSRTPPYHSIRPIRASPPTVPATHYWMSPHGNYGPGTPTLGMMGDGMHLGPYASRPMPAGWGTYPGYADQGTYWVRVSDHPRGYYTTPWEAPRPPRANVVAGTLPRHLYDDVTGERIPRQNVTKDVGNITHVSKLNFNPDVGDSQRPVEDFQNISVITIAK